ncbi:hypothetical protein Tco_0332066 [Tanacetum coccineum]
MVRVESLSDDPLTAKMSVLHCMIMSHSGELLARYHGLNQSHHEFVLSTDSKLKGYEEKVASLTVLELQVSTLKKKVSGLNDKLATSDASFSKSKAKGKERKKRLSPLLKGFVRKFLASDEFSRVQGELLSLAASARFERGLSMHRTKDEFVVVLKNMVNFMPGAQDRLVEASSLLEFEKLACPDHVPTLRDTRASPPIAKESTVTPVSKSLELSVNVVPASSVVASERNEDQVYVVVDGSDLEMADSVVPSKSGGVFVQGVSRILDDVVKVAAVESERISSSPTNVVVALFADGKGDVLIPSSVAGEEVIISSSRV